MGVAHKQFESVFAGIPGPRHNKFNPVPLRCSDTMKHQINSHSANECTEDLFCMGALHGNQPCIRRCIAHGDAHGTDELRHPCPVFGDV